jgi:glutaminyl-peptide cyclotransferase
MSATASRRGSPAVRPRVAALPRTAGLLLLVLVPLLVRAGEFSGPRSFALLEELCAFGPRVPGSEAHQASGDWLLERLGALCDESSEEPFLHRPSAGHPLEAAHPGGIAMRNLIGRFRPEEERRVLLGAHWDSRPFSDRDPDSTRQHLPVLGANDAASSVAVLLHLAERFAEDPPPMGVDIVFFDGEDFGREGDLDEYLLGSRVHARQLAWPRPAAGLLLDMICKHELRIPVEAFSWQRAPQVVRIVWDEARRLGYGHLFVPEMGPAIMDDHLPLLDVGVPMINLIDFDFPEWHTTADTPAICDPTSLEAVGRVVESVLRTGRLP